MTKQMKMVIGAIVAIVLIAGGVMFLLPKNTTAPTENTPVAQEGDSSKSMTKGSIKSLLGAGKNTTCKITYPDGSGSGTVYVSGSKVRGDFIITSNGQTMESHMIQDGQYGYFWSGGAQGTKIKLDAALPTPTPGASTMSEDLDKEVDLDCSSWSVDDSKFTVPADIKFTDVSASMEQMQKQTQKAPKNEQQENACDQFTDPPAKALCESMAGQ